MFYRYLLQKLDGCGALELLLGLIANRAGAPIVTQLVGALLRSRLNADFIVSSEWRVQTYY
jgi:hypothetical protein